MNDYILFLDTETSDKPREWNASTKEVEKWPYILQIAWTIYKSNGDYVLTRNYYINPGEISINKESQRVHGITLSFVRDFGVKRQKAMEILMADLAKYTPMLVGHFVLFDLKMVEVAFNRIGMPQDFSDFDKFCTMQNTRPKRGGAGARLLRLGELYQLLFEKPLKNQHNAKVDALATKDCFFELVRKGSITDKTIDDQKSFFNPRRTFLDRIFNINVK